MMVQAPKEVGEGSAVPTDPHHTSTTTQPSTSRPHKKQSRRKQRKGTEIPQSSSPTEEHEPTHSNYPRLNKVTLIDETQGRNDKDLMFNTGVLNGDEVFVKTEEHVVNAATTTSSIPVSAADLVTTAEIKAAKPKAVTTAATTVTPVRSRAKGIIFHDQEEQAHALIFSSSQSQLPEDKDKAELEEEEKLARQKEVEANIALIESWDNTQAMIEADRLLAERLQAREQEELTNKEKARLFVELLEKRKKHFAALRAQEKRNKPPTKAQKKSTMVNMFVDMDTKMKEGSKKAKANTAQESSSKIAGDELEQEKAKKQKIDDDQEEAKMRKLIEIVPDKEEVAMDAIPLAIKPPSIVDWKIIKERKIGFYQIKRADGNSKRYSAFIIMIKDFDRDDLETLWRLVKAKHGDTRPEEEYERVLWGDLKVMFEPDIRSEVWRSLQGYKVTIYKLFDSCRGRIVGIKRLHDDLEVSTAQEASTFEELKHRLSTIPVLSLPDFNKVVLTAMQRRLWDPVIKSAFQDDPLRARGTVADYQNEFEMVISQVTGKSESFLTSIYIFGLKPTLQRALLWSNPTTLGEAFSLTRIAEARFEDERSITDIAKTNLNAGVQVQDLEEMIRYKSNKIEAFQTSMVATFEEHEQQENQDNLNEIFEEKDDAKPPISTDTFGSNGGNDSRTSGSKTPAKEVVDNGIKSGVVVGLLEEFQEGYMVDALSRVE
ncbi:hypothetical protein Tco_0892847 [Tanacetum coccineum]|uniref:Uncharacterized protein n=1 Tax=Tanacetum coccineum TaxID=301880 RepID=A0ABQ5C7F4_9ASTR